MILRAIKPTPDQISRGAPDATLVPVELKPRAYQQGWNQSVRRWHKGKSM